MISGLITPQGTDSFKADTWVKVYENTLTSAQTSVTISGLDGDTDVMYRLSCRFINGYSGASTYQLQPNNDTGTNYGHQRLSGDNTAVSAYRITTDTKLNLGYVAVQNNICQSEMILYAKSGYVRLALGTEAEGITGTTVAGIYLRGLSWNNTADNITSLVISSNQTNGLGIGSYIYLEKLVLS